MTERPCFVCGRPLRDPVSVMTGVGPNCARTASGIDPEPELFEAAYFSELVDGVLVIFDCDCGSISVTNAAATVLWAEAARGPLPELVIYRDSDGQYDRMLHRCGVFGGFTALNASTMADAIAAAKATV
jgi:Family of unknown function (DUF6011)